MTQGSPNQEVGTTTNPGQTLARLESELREIWAPDLAGPSKTRVCTMNLVVVAGSPALADRYLHIADEVTRSILARAIVVALDPDSKENTLTGDVNAVCSLEGEQQICTERVRLTATGTVCARVASAVEALLVPEIPTALVWLGKVYVDDPVFESLAVVADRVITDSEYASLSSLLHLVRWSRGTLGGTRESGPPVSLRLRARPSIADLAWVRLAPWQELVARFFDEPSFSEHAHKITRLVLKQASERGARLGSEGALLLGWLATRLGWKASRLGGALRFKRPDGENVVVEFGTVPRPEGVAPSALGAVAIEADADGQKLAGSLERDLASGLEGTTPDADVVLWKLGVGDAQPFEQRVRFGPNKGAKWLERTLHRPANDPSLVEAALFAEDVVEDGIVCN
jgi:glucose-6-phosphate dehydrogenase assembly protein OpcA